MSQAKRIQQLNEQELREGISTSASWHQDYRDTSYIFIGNLPKEMNEMDILIAFSQYGVPTFLKLMRDRESGESKKFAFLRYEDFRSTILAVENLNGYEIYPKFRLTVDHVRYKPIKYVGNDDANKEWDEAIQREMEKDMITAEEATVVEEPKLIEEKDDELADPMADYIEEKKEDAPDSDHRHHHHHHRHHHHHHRHHHHRHHPQNADGHDDKRQKTTESST